MDMEHDHDEDDSPSRGGSLGPESDVGGSKGGASVRKAQNRIAQREFRLRKQQYIRDLEARVEVLSGDKEERVELMTLLIRNLLKENKDLRSMVKTMASFVGEGLGSCLPRLGLTAPQLDAILNRADTDTAHDAFLTLKASKEMQEANPGLPLGEVKRKASTSISGAKRRRDGTGTAEHDADHDFHSNSTPGGAEKRFKEEQNFGGPSTSAASANASSQYQSQQEQAQQPTNYDFFFPDLEAMANGRYPPQIMGSPFNPHAQQSGFPFFSGPGMGGWAVQGAPDQSPNNQSYGLGMGMGFGVPMGYGPNGQNQANFSGFGLTMPGGGGAGNNGQLAGSSSGQSGLFTGTGGNNGQSGYSPSTNASNQQTQNQAGPSRTGSGSGSGSGMAGPNEPLTEKSRRLKEAVASLTEGDRRVLEGNPMTPQEMAERFKVQEKLMSSLPEGDQNNRMLEAMQMITYHLNNFRVNPNYVLPNSLRPTKVQKTIAHEHAIDGIIYPSIRDRMILLRGRYDIVEAFYAILNEFRLNGEDPLDHNNWELSERWLTEFRILCDDEIFDITNRWRAQRGEPPIPKTDNPIMRGDYGPPSAMYNHAQ